jgi:hypothetical protein
LSSATKHQKTCALLICQGTCFLRELSRQSCRKLSGLDRGPKRLSGGARIPPTPSVGLNERGGDRAADDDYTKHCGSVVAQAAQQASALFLAEDDRAAPLLLFLVLIILITGLADDGRACGRICREL